MCAPAVSATRLFFCEEKDGLLIYEPMTRTQRELSSFRR